MTTTDPTTGTQKAQPVRNVQAYLAAAQVLITAIGAISWVDNPSWQTVLLTLLPALGAAYSAYQAKALPQKVVPYEDAATYVDKNGTTVAGPASALPDGTPISDTPADSEPLEAEKNVQAAVDYSDQQYADADSEEYDAPVQDETPDVTGETDAEVQDQPKS